MRAKRRYSSVRFSPDMLPIEKPRYLMGVGKPTDIVGAVKRGVDMMDCVLPLGLEERGRLLHTEVSLI